MELAVRPSVQTVPADERAPRASIIIVNYNAGGKLQECIESLQRYGQRDCQVIVVDNASCDGMADLIEITYPGVVLIRSDSNIGFGAGNNMAAAQATGEYLAFLNPDTVVEPGWLEALLRPFESDNRIGLVTSKIVLADDTERINACGNAVHITGLTLCRGLGQARHAFNNIEDVDAVSGAAFVIRRGLFGRLEGFEEDAFLYMEDTDLSLRARLLGWRSVCAPDSVALHHYALRIGAQKIFYQERNRYLMLLKILKWPTLFVLLPALLLGEVISWGFVLYNDRAHFKNKLRAYAWVINNWSKIMRKRRAVQRCREVNDRELLHRTTHKLEFHQAAAGVTAKLAAFLFNPVFFLLRTIALIVVWW